MKKLFQSLKWFMIFILSLFIILDIYLRVQGGPLNRGGLVLKFILLWVLLYRSRISWVTGISICIYGIYSVLFVSINASEPLASEFTSSIRMFFSINSIATVWRVVINLGPLIFYFVSLIAFLTKPVLRYYHVIK